jgi:hypothetical protein
MEAGQQAEPASLEVKGYLGRTPELREYDALVERLAHAWEDYARCYDEDPERGIEYDDEGRMNRYHRIVYENQFNINANVTDALEGAVCDLIGFPQPFDIRFPDHEGIPCSGTGYAPPGSRIFPGTFSIRHVNALPIMDPDRLRCDADRIERERPADAAELRRWADGVEGLSSCWDAYVTIVGAAPPPDNDEQAWAARVRAHDDAHVALEDAVRELIGGPEPAYYRFEDEQR